MEQLSREQLQEIVDQINAGSVEAMLKLSNYQNALLNDFSEQPGSTMIHERDYQPMKCCLCGKDMPSIHDTHNPAPLAPHTYAKEALEKNLPHRCCSECDRTKVIPTRIAAIANRKKSKKKSGKKQFFQY